MENFRIDVVGLSHHEVRAHFQEYVRDAVGRQLVLQPQRENLKDPYAVRVREEAVHIGYVAVPDLDVVYQALKGSGLKRLRATVVESHEKPPVLTVEAAVEHIDWTYEPFDDTPYRGWHYDGLPLLPRRMERLDDIADDLLDMLRGGEELSPTMSAMLDELLRGNLYDVSREMTRARYQLQRLLAERQEPALREAAGQLRRQKGMLMSHESRDKVARYLFIDLPTLLRQQGLEESHYTYDNRLDELEAQLKAFPFQLYDKFLSDPVDFLREVYYKHVPRHYLAQLLSGIVLIILKGCVSIQRWGREGDNEPIMRINSLAAPLCDDDRQKLISEGIRELLSKRNARGNLIITQKNQWAAILSILTFDFGVESTDLRDLCRQMAAWGFGQDSRLKCYCDYESVAKCSNYATLPFNKWSGAGTAHQRQVHAAVEVRAILRPKIARLK